MSKKTKAAPEAKALAPEKKSVGKSAKKTKAVTPRAPTPNPEVEALRVEITELRKALTEKLARLSDLGGQMGGESATVMRVLEMMRGSKGATKQELVEETGAKKGYIDALVNRILPAKGYILEGKPREGDRVKAYRIDG